MSSELHFGYRGGLPVGATVAWGARAIVTQDGAVDLVHDRQSHFGPEEGVDWLLGRLNGGVADRWTSEAARLLRQGEMDTRVAQEFVLFEDGEVRVLGNTHGSCGYLYVVAFPIGEAA
jgi:hypothetical protein